MAFGNVTTFTGATHADGLVLTPVKNAILQSAWAQHLVRRLATFELDTGGGLLIDASYSIGRADWSANEFNHDRTRFFGGYVFGRGDRSRVFAGISYNTYKAEHVAVTTTQYENDQSWNIIAGVRARSDTFVGTAELCAVGEYGFRLGLSFGF